MNSKSRTCAAILALSTAALVSACNKPAEKPADTAATKTDSAEAKDGDH